MTRQEFVKKYGATAVKVTKGTGIFPETLLAQASVESANGQSMLSAKYYNFFGIKAGSSWQGKKVVLKTREVINQKDMVVPDAFRVYDSFAQSASDYVKLLTTGKNFKAQKVAGSPNYTEQIKRIKAAGYATDPNYVPIISKVAAGISNQIPSSNISLISVLVLGLAGYGVGRYQKWW